MPKIKEAKKKKVKEIPDLGQSLTEYRVEGGGANLIYHLDTRCTSNNRLGGCGAVFLRGHQTDAVTSDKQKENKMTV